MPPQWEQMDGLAVNFRGTGLCKSSEDVAFSGYANLCSEREVLIEAAASLGFTHDALGLGLDPAAIRTVGLYFWFAGAIWVDENGHVVKIQSSRLEGNIPPAFGKLTNLRVPGTR